MLACQSSDTNNYTYIYNQLNSIYTYIGKAIICLYMHCNGPKFWSYRGGGWKNPLLRSWKLQRVWQWNFHQILVSIRRHEIDKKNGFVCKLQTEFRKNLLFGNAFFRQAILTNILQDYLSWRQNVILNILDRFLKYWIFYITICKIPQKAGL